MKKTICLNMIVKNESSVIRRCLASVIRLIDYWVIVDTGSTDGTQRIIRECLAPIGGELHERPWVNFAYNRNEALLLAQNKGDYLLFIDADEQLQFSPSFAMPNLTKDFYVSNVEVEGGVRIHRELMVNNHLPWTWVGVVHEAITCPLVKSYELLSHVINHARQDGHRSQNLQKFLMDAQILRQALKDDPHNSRNQFYLAFSYDVAGRYGAALKQYQECVLMNGFAEEVFYSLYRIAWLQEQLGKDFETIVDSYSRAFLARPSRVEPLFYLANFYVRKNKPLLAYFVSRYAQMIPPPDDHVMVDYPLYSYRLLEQWADICYLLGRFDETIAAYRKLLVKSELPIEDRLKIESLLQNLTLQG
jgi:glycosyltransferase involved in cell wall biosynthesis